MIKAANKQIVTINTAPEHSAISIAVLRRETEYHCGMIALTLVAQDGAPVAFSVISGDVVLGSREKSSAIARPCQTM